MFKIVKKAEIGCLERERNEAEEELRKVRRELYVARMLLDEISIKINNGVTKEDMGPFTKAEMLYQLMAYNHNDSKTIKRFHGWVLPKDEI